ncbi:MAG TPA: T9SS type A sorting domain-containing protein [Saprospiraceae bacterium]|nr:T9SS type A sorting domain-containing protein [Saprospiraceae bacterium]
MLTYTWHLHTTVLIISFSSILLCDLNSQCNPPDQLPSHICAAAPLTCLSDACYSTLNVPFVCCNNFCGLNTIINNPQYFQFIATATDVQVQIHVDNCSSGLGLQSAIVTFCGWQPCPGGNVPCADILDCNPGTSPGGTMVLNASGLVIGQTYWLLIDGNTESVCQYTIEYLTGVFEPQIYEEITMGESIPAVVCQGFDDFIMTAGPYITNAQAYEWHLEWNTTIITSPLPFNTIDIANNAPVGTWDICVRAFSGCDTSDIIFCFPVEIVALEDVEKDPATFCPEEFPFFWLGISIAGPGTYRKTLNNSNGCPYDSIWNVDAYPDVIPGFLDTISCQFPFFYQGFTYYDVGTYALDLPDMSIHGCDSFATLQLDFEFVDLFIEQLCIEGQSLLIPYLIESTLTVDTILYTWYTCGLDTLLSDQKNLVINAPGCYCLIYDSGSCSNTICSYYNLDPCSDSCSVISKSICVDESVLFYYDGPVTPGASYHWLIDIPGSSEVLYAESDTVEMTYDTTGCYQVSLTIVTDTSSFTCTDSFCIESPATTVSICCSLVSCVDCVDLSFILTGTAPWTIILSSSAGLDTISGILTPSFTHTVCINQEIDTFTIIGVTGSEDLCTGTILGDNFVIIAHAHDPIPVISITADTLLCAPDNMLSYNWHECDSTITIATTQCFTPPASGCYCVEVLSFEGCMAFACFDFVVATNEPSFKNGISVFPNPTPGHLAVRLPENISLPVEWNLYNVHGIKHENGIITEPESSLHLEKLTPGVYLMKLISRYEQVRVFKIIVQ